MRSAAYRQLSRLHIFLRDLHNNPAKMCRLREKRVDPLPFLYSLTARLLDEFDKMQCLLDTAVSNIPRECRTCKWENEGKLAGAHHAPHCAKCAAGLFKDGEITSHDAWEWNEKPIRRK